MIHLHVWLRLPEGYMLRAGEIRVADPDPRRGGLLRGEFRYDPDYLSHPDAFALDPFHLPLSDRIFSADRPQSGIHGIFEDSLPDDWGRHLLIRQFRLGRNDQSPPRLLALLGTGCLGALAYTTTPAPPEFPPSPVSADLETLIAAAGRYDDNPGELTEDTLALLFRAASSPGGARPKVIIAHQAGHWIAKLRSSRDPVDMVRVEAASLVLARKAGLEVPEFRVETMGKRSALLIRRFDIAPEGGRFHTASMQTVAGVEGYYRFGYSNMADILRQIACQPERDLPRLFRQAVFNLFLGNTDDHLKNFALLRDQTGWRLTPAFDLIPDVPLRGEHVLDIGLAGNHPSKAGIEQMAKGFGLSAAKRKQILADVAAAFLDWEGVFQDQCVPEEDLMRLRGDIERRRALLS